MGAIPRNLIPSGMKNIIRTVKISVMPTPRVRSSFLARQAAAVAIAADTPQTEVALAMMIASFLFFIFNQRVAKMNMKMTTTGVTIQATINPGGPRERIFPNRISAPRSTRPVLMNNSVRAAAFSQLGVPMVLEINSPIINAHMA